MGEARGNPKLKDKYADWWADHEKSGRILDDWKRRGIGEHCPGVGGTSEKHS